MELTPIKYFVKLADVLSFTQASKDLYITQSTLSISIKQLEDELGVKLFDRIGKKVYLTDEGNLFLDYSRKALDYINSGIQEINARNNIYQGDLSIGVTYSTCEILNSCIVKYSQKYPDVNLRVKMLITVDDVIDNILSNKLDIAITYKPDNLPASIDVMPLEITPLCVVAHKDHPIGQKEYISLKELSKYPFVTYEKGMYTRGISDRLFMKNDVQVTPHLEVNDVNLVLDMVDTGHWVSVLTPLSIQNKPDCRAVKIIGETAYLSVCVLWLKGKNKKILYQTLFDEILNAQKKGCSL